MTKEEKQAAKQAAKERKEELKRARAKQMAKEREKNGNFFQRAGKGIAKWFREMRSELKKVVWPSKTTIKNNTAVSLLMMAAFAVVVWAFDALASNAVQLIISIGG